MAAATWEPCSTVDVASEVRGNTGKPARNPAATRLRNRLEIFTANGKRCRQEEVDFIKSIIAQPEGKHR